MVFLKTLATSKNKAYQFLSRQKPVIRNSMIGAVVFLIAFPAYMIANYTTDIERAVQIFLPIDHVLPFIHESVIIYAWVYVFLFLPVFMIASLDYFIQVAYSYLFIAAISVSFFIIFPVYYPRTPLPHQDTFLMWGTTLNYLIDRPVNCFPSMHVSNAFMAAFTVIPISRKIGYTAFLAALAISVSTMTLKQHYFADIIGGLVIALVAWLLFIKKELNQIPYSGRQQLSMPAHNALFVIAIYAVFVGSMAVAFALGVKWPLDMIVN